jgi:IS5 family transposase
LFKTMLIQRWYDLSDPAAEDCLNDRKSFARFVGLSLDEKAPDHSTICRFRNKLIAEDLMAPLIERLMRQIEAKDLVLKQGTIMDASLIHSAAHPPAAPRRNKAAPQAVDPPAGDDDSAAPQAAAPETADPPDADEAADPYASGKLSKLDPDARWARKGKDAWFGYKIHIAIDDEHRIIRAHKVTAANVNDCVIGPSLVQPDGGAHYADKGYSSKPMRQTLAEHGLADGVMQLGNRHYPLRPAERWRNRVLTKIRYVVEGVFGEFKRNFGFRRARYIGLAKVQFECDLAVIAFNIKTMALAA